MITTEQISREILGEFLPPVLFHYTSLKGVIGIINSRTIQASCIDDLQDVSELRRGANLIYEEAIRAVRAGAPPLAQAVLPKISDYAQKRCNRVFVVCFCASPTSKFHWAQYGKYCLHVNTDPKRGHVLRSGISKVHIQYHPVIYDEDKQRTAVRQAIKNVITALEQNTFGRYEISSRDWNTNFLARAASELLLDLLATFKGPDYADDEEWRLVARPWPVPCSSAPDWDDSNFDVAIQTCESGPGHQRRRYIELYASRNHIWPPPGLRADVPFSAVIQDPLTADLDARALIRRTLIENGSSEIEVGMGEL